MPDNRPLTDNEGALLSLVLRQQPITGYQIGRFFEASPVHTFNTSKGKLYPLIHRLRERGLLAAEEVAGDHRGTQRFVCTEAGRQVLKEWVLSIRPEHELLHDPLRKKVQAFDLLTTDEQREWIEAAKKRLERKLREVEQWSPEIEGPFGDIVQESAKAALQGRISWLERALERVNSR
ncbi:MAG TPA: helix-turn-helix transcriptional regulator [Allosphingosinicella sp.]|nr:helix-turn-helix transcriptional regulator [Allosphingosinicella sp.]